jgi:lipoprotein NlpD
MAELLNRTLSYNINLSASSRTMFQIRSFTVITLAAMAVGLGACATKTPAPVIERSTGAAARPAAGTPTAPAASTAPAPVTRTPIDPRAPTYTVQRGDNLYRIALEHGQAWRDLAAWNSLEDPGKIEVGQVLRVLPPDSGVQTAPVASGSVATRPIGTPAAAPVGTPTNNTPANSSPAPAQVAKAPESAAPGPEDDGIAFAWPARGSVLEGFNDVKNKGIDIGGRAGDPVLAAADGKVVYAANGLRGYGNLVIIKHNNTYLTAYAHNQALAVKENQVIKKGQKIAEMGSSDAERVKLHFEIRRLGKPVDPLRLLPDKP